MAKTLFESSMDKLALVVNSSVRVKEQMIREDGIGEDISTTFFVWSGAELKAITQMTSATMQLKHELRFASTVDAMVILRQSLCVDAITMAAEGYVSSDPSATADMSLEKAFVELPAVVKECLTFTHIFEDQVMFVTKPYRYSVPRSVQWEDELFLPGQTLMRGGNGRYPLMMSKIMNEVECDNQPLDLETYFSTIEFGLNRIGFNTTWL